MSRQEFEPVIGLEVHVQLKTVSKMFCGCSTKFGAPPNTQVCPVCLGLPGVLPVINRKAVEFTLAAGLAVNCTIAPFSKFDRKNYFYPDLPKGFQISQYDIPLTENGWIDISNKRIKITRAHLEEDAGKLVHSPDKKASYVDLNRAGVPLLEIVSEPDMNSPEEAYEYLTKLKRIIGYLDISDCNMEEGSLRCDANISLRPRGSSGLGVKAELKNMNSFKGVQRALSYEIGRQTETLLSGNVIVQETRLWEANSGVTHSMRSKEEAHDYRYFPEPDLVPLEIQQGDIDRIKKLLPEMPDQRRRRIIAELGLPDYDVGVLTSSRALADYFEAAVAAGSKEKVPPKLISNWIMSELMRDLNKDGITADKSPISPSDICGLVQLIQKGTINGKIAKDVFVQMYKSGSSAEEIIKKKGLTQINDEDVIVDIACQAIKDNPKSVEAYRGGKQGALMHLVGQVMKATRGKANPAVAQKVLKERL